MGKLLAEMRLLIGGAEPDLDTSPGVRIVRSTPYSVAKECMEGLALLAKGDECLVRLRSMGFGAIVQAVLLTGLDQFRGLCPGHRICERSEPFMVARLGSSAGGVDEVKADVICQERQILPPGPA